MNSEPVCSCTVRRCKECKVCYSENHYRAVCSKGIKHPAHLCGAESKSEK